MENISPEKIAYNIAYRLLPELFFENHSAFLEILKMYGRNTGQLFYEMICDLMKIKPDDEIKEQYNTEKIKFDENTYGLLIVFPKPKPQKTVKDLDDMLEKIDNLLEKRVETLAPYFALPISNLDDSSKVIFILEQDPIGGTALRRLTGDGTNANLGDGCAPEKLLFIDFVKEKLSEI